MCLDCRLTFGIQRSHTDLSTPLTGDTSQESCSSLRTAKSRTRLYAPLSSFSLHAFVHDNGLQTVLGIIRNVIADITGNTGCITESNTDHCRYPGQYAYITY
jgi:hypothetical protein